MHLECVFQMEAWLTAHYIEHGLQDGQHEVNMWPPHALHTPKPFTSSTPASVTMATGNSGSPFSLFELDIKITHFTRNQEDKTAATE